MKLAMAVAKTANKKLGPMATTYVCKASCPESCPFRATKSCYGHSGPIATVWNRTGGKEQWEMGPEALSLAAAKEEAAAIDSLDGTAILRLHTLGDCSTNEAAKIVSEAAERYIKKHNQKVFTWTHAWREVDRASWGKVSVLASCETEDEVKQALARGYAASIVVQHDDVHSKPYMENGVRYIPCPHQEGRVENCGKCGICVNAKRIKAVVRLKAHGPKLKAGKMLREKNGEPPKEK